MRQLPSRPVPGQQIPQQWFGQMWDFLAELRASVAPPAAPEKNQGKFGRDSALVKVTSGSGTTYVGDVYGRGPDQSATETGVTVRLANGSATIVAATGLYYVAVPMLWTESGQQYLRWTIVGDAAFPGETNTPPAGEDNAGDGGIQTWCVTSSGESYDVELDSAVSWHGRIIESWMATWGQADAVPSDDLRYTGYEGADLVTDGTYTLYVDTDGSLHVRATAAADKVQVTVVAGGQCTNECGAYGPLPDEFEAGFTWLYEWWGVAECTGAPDSTDNGTETVTLTKDTGQCRWTGRVEPGGHTPPVAFDLILTLSSGTWELQIAYDSAPDVVSTMGYVDAGNTYPVGSYTVAVSNGACADGALGSHQKLTLSAVSVSEVP